LQNNQPLDRRIAGFDSGPDYNGSALDPEPAGRPIPRDPDALLFDAEMAYLLGLSPRTLESLRLRGDGPPYLKIGRSVRYQRAVGLAWAAGKTRHSTSGK
jgi:hypothetical protein